MDAVNQGKMEQLAIHAATVAMDSSIKWLHSNGYKPNNLSDSEIEGLVLILRRQVKVAIEEGLRDASEALDCGMDQVAVGTFLASMRLAGINSAKEFVGVA